MIFILITNKLLFSIYNPFEVNEEKNYRFSWNGRDFINCTIIFWTLFIATAITSNTVFLRVNIHWRDPNKLNIVQKSFPRIQKCLTIFYLCAAHNLSSPESLLCIDQNCRESKAISRQIYANVWLLAVNIQIYCFIELISSTMKYICLCI